MESEKLENLRKKIGGKLVKVVGCSAMHYQIDGEDYGIYSPSAYIPQKDMIEYAESYGRDAYIDISLALIISKSEFKKLVEKYGDADELEDALDIVAIENVYIYGYESYSMLLDDDTGKIAGCVYLTPEKHIFVKREDMTERDW